jgi:hypothetical protein
MYCTSNATAEWITSAFHVPDGIETVLSSVMLMYCPPKVDYSINIQING